MVFFNKTYLYFILNVTIFTFLPSFLFFFPRRINFKSNQLLQPPTPYKYFPYFSFGCYVPSVLSPTLRNMESRRVPMLNSQAQQNWLLDQLKFNLIDLSLVLCPNARWLSTLLSGLYYDMTSLDGGVHARGAAATLELRWCQMTRVEITTVFQAFFGPSTVLVTS